MKARKITATLSALTMTATLFTPFHVTMAAATTLTVNPSQAASETNFLTIRGAVEKAKELNPQNEADRVTINIAPGSYEEQVRMDGMKYVTLQKTPGEEGIVTLHWYFCTGYCTANTDLTGLYDPNIDWSLDQTWNGYNEGDEHFTRYAIGQDISNVSTISYYTKDGVKHKDVPRNSQLKNLGGLGWSYDKMAPLIVTKTSSDITIKDLNLVNSIPVMVTQGQKDGHVTPEAGRYHETYQNYDIPLRDTNSLTVCDEGTPYETPTSVLKSDGSVDYKKFDDAVKAGTIFTAGESAFLANSSVFNERGHAIAILGDRITVENVRVRGNQDSVWVSDGRTYFKNCDLLGGTDYIYGSASAVFDNCRLGFVGFSDKAYGSPLATPNTPGTKKYGYLFWNCTVYNLRENNLANNFGGAWGPDGQETFVNTTLDNGNTFLYGKSKAAIERKGFGRFNAEQGRSRLYEYGTKNADGTPVDITQRIVNKSTDEGGPGMGTALDKWQVLEFNPRNVFGATNGWPDNWDPMSFTEEISNVDSALGSANVSVPAGEETEITLPSAPAGMEYKWTSDSTNAVVSSDGTKITVVRPAAGESAINTNVTLYARDTVTGYGDKKEVPVSIAATTDMTNVFSMPVTVTQSAVSESANNYTVTISKEGALIKKQTITVAAGTKTATATISNIPSTAEGIDYDVKVVSFDNNFTISAPVDGQTTVKGITGTPSALNITAQRLVDEEINLDITTAAANGNKTYDLISLAKAKGADDSISSSDFVTVTYDVSVGAAPSQSSFIDLSSGTPSNANSATPQRFILAKINNSWTQIDTVDNSQGFSGSSDSGGQCLNITGKFDYSTTKHTVTSTINYKDKTVSVTGSDSGAYYNNKFPYTFEHFPESAVKGTVNMGVFPGSTSDNWTISNVRVKYKKIVTDVSPSETEAPTETIAPVETMAPTGTPTVTTTPTNTPVVTAAPTNTPVITVAPTNTPVITAVPTNTPVITAVPTNTPVITAVPTNTPVVTAEPTNTPAATEAPGNAQILTAVAQDGKTTVTLANITNGIVLAAEYNGEIMKKIKTADVTSGTIIIEGIEADKVMVWDSLSGMKPICPPKDVAKGGTEPVETTTPTAAPSPTAKPFQATTIDLTSLSEVPVYSEVNGQGFVEKSSAITPASYARQVAPTSAIDISSGSAKVTESTGSYLHKKTNSLDGDDYNNGGLIYRVDTGKPGAYHLEVELTGTSADTFVAPTGMQASRLTSTGSWDTAGGIVPHTVSAFWSGNTWAYDFATGEDFIEIEVEPSTLPTASAPQTVGIKKIKISPIEENAAGEKPTIHILGDSTQKTYNFNEYISAWGQTFENYFNPEKVNVINYSMGGRAMKSNYNEGRFNEALIRGKKGDFVFIHSAHNDETVSTNRFSRGAGVANDLEANNENYNKWLNMYVEAIKARGMTPVLVTGMPRTSNGRANTSDSKPNGFNPDSPGSMRAKASSDNNIGLIELFTGAAEYLAKLDSKEAIYIYEGVEAGETPANNAANGTKGGGTHYNEAASKQFNRIMLQSIYDQSVATDDAYTDKAIMERLVSLMSDNVKNAVQTKNWSNVFPEMASDVSAVDIVPGAQKQAEANYYYRNNIEKALQLGLLYKNTQNLFKPTDNITVGEFARSVERVFGLDTNSLTNYNKTYAQLQAANTSPASLFTDDGITLYSEGDAAGEGDITITVTQPTGGTVTVYNNSAFATLTTDLPANVTVNQQLADNDNYTLSAPSVIEENGKGTDKGGVFSDNSIITTNYVDIRKSGSDTSQYKMATYTAKKDGIITVYCRAGATKPMALEKTKDGTSVQKYVNDGDGTGTGNVYGTVTFNVTAGESYYIYTSGGTGRLFGIKYESTSYPQSTTALNVTSGDEIKVVAEPAENHINSSILINGESKTTAKEYIFNATNNTTVTATFKSEPSIVETAMVASDAALTRQVMGAIFYDAYKAAEAKYSGVSGSIWTNIQKYMAQTGGVPKPGDPGYDPNIQYESATYFPLTGWGALTDTDELDNSLFAKVKASYNLGLIRSENGIKRGSVINGTSLEPTTAVTRAKAAKALVFAFILTQPQTTPSQTIPQGFGMAEQKEIVIPNSEAQSTVFVK